MTSGSAVREQFVDSMMRNLTSETVFLLTTFVNMASSRNSDSAEEREFINTLTLELFEVFNTTFPVLCIDYHIVQNCSRGKLW